MRFSATLYTLRAHCYTFAQVLRFCVSVFTLVKKKIDLTRLKHMHLHFELSSF